MQTNHEDFAMVDLVRELVAAPEWVHRRYVELRTSIPYTRPFVALEIAKAEYQNLKASEVL
jgi:hypothetical protein